MVSSVCTGPFLEYKLMQLNTSKLSWKLTFKRYNLYSVLVSFKSAVFAIEVCIALKYEVANQLLSGGWGEIISYQRLNSVFRGRYKFYLTTV